MLLSKHFSSFSAALLLTGCMAADPCFDEIDPVRTIDTSITQLSAIGVQDLNGDDQLDIIAQGGDGEGMYWYEQQDEQFTEHFITDGLNEGYEIEAADFDRDGDIDLFAISDQGKLIYLEQVTADGDLIRFEEHELADITCGLYCQIAIADFDQNSINDLFVCTATAAHCYLFSFTNDKALEWSRTELQLYAFYITNLDVIDANGDAYPDIYYSRYSEYTAGIMLNNQSGGFQLQPRTIPDLYGSTSFADVTGDGLPDYITPGGVFGAKNEFIGFDNVFFGLPQSVIGYDVDGDGDNDVLGSTRNGYYLRVNENRVFSRESAKKLTDLDAVYQSNSIARPILIADVNQDGSPDLVGDRLLNGKIFWADIPALCADPVN